MSNNPFLKTKESSKVVNNRFHSLQDDDNTSLYKYSSNNKKNITYDSSSNSFTQPSRPDRDRDRDRDMDKPSDRDRNINRDRDNNYRNNNNFIRSKPRYPSPPPPIVDIQINNTELFPDLISKNNNTTNSVKTSTNFKQILTNVVEVQKPKKNPIPPGWVSITMSNNNIVYENEQLTPFLIKHQKQEQIQIEKENDINYSMNIAINSMRKIWDRYENEYNEIHGEGAYEEKFRLSPVYASDYYSESDEETFEEENDEL